MSRKYCYHITNGATRSALQCGTVTADSMEEAAEIAARRAGLEQREYEDIFGFPACHWFKGNKRRSVYILHDPKPATA